MFIQTVLVLHRYLGVVLGVLMTLWCVSGFVMMYQAFPDTTAKERLAGLAPLTAASIASLSLPDDGDASAMRIEMAAGRAVLRGASQENAPLDRDAIADIATRFAQGNAIAGAITRVEPIAIDQWTVAMARRQAPIWKVSFGDAKHTFVYVSGKSGEVIQDANSSERLLSWFGAIPHWLYPTLLRENAPVWTQVVIWSAALGTFLTLTGIFVGIVKLRGKSGNWFPYRRPVWFIHHVFGVFAGVLVLTWTFSGLLTMQPWGLFETPSAVSRQDVTGEMNWADARPMLSRVNLSDDIVQLRAAPLFGQPAIIATARDGSQTRYGADGASPLDIDNFTDKVAAKYTDAEVRLLLDEDDYYYSHHDAVKLPVLRVDLADADKTHIYLDPQSGAVLRVADATAKRYRWLENGLHRLDFPILRARPLWDIVVLPLLLAVTIVCAAGAWLSFMRVGRDVKAVRDKLRAR